MSICITQKSGSYIEIDELDGGVYLFADGLDLTPAEARRVAQFLVKYAARAEDKNPGSKLGAAGGRAAAAKLTKEQRSERARRAVEARWARRRDI